MATKTGRRKKATASTKKSVVFSILDQDPNISTEDALKELKRRKVDMGERPKQNFYSVKTLWKQERGRKMNRSGPKRGSKHGGRRARTVERTVSQDLEVEVQILRADNAKLKATIAILLS